MDFDPRGIDSRDDDRYGLDRDRGHRDGSDHDRDWDDWRRPDGRDRDDDARELGRGPGDSRQADGDKHGHDPREDARGLEREREGRDRDFDPREALTRDVRLPRGLEREIVRHRDREYTLRGSESRTLATVGAFRVVSSRDLRDSRDRELDPRSGDLRHLREQGLVETVRVPGTREHAVVLTKEGRGVLESHRDRDRDDRQTFYDGLKRERELEHDVQVYRAYEHYAERLREEGARIERVILDYQLRSEYERWLHERDRDRDNYDGHPDRTPEEIREWALEHDLKYFDDEVHFPDLRIEYGTARLTDKELYEFFDRPFPQGFAGFDVVAEIAPEGWEHSPMLACFHPSVEQIYEESVQLHRNMEAFRSAQRRRRADVEIEYVPSPEPTLDEIRSEYRSTPVEWQTEMTDLIGLCLWDVFSDGHDVIVADGRVAHLGSFRGSGAFLDEYLTRPLYGDGRGDGNYMRFYMGTAWISERADLTPVYAMIFRRLRSLGAEWMYHFPELYLTEFGAADMNSEPHKPYSVSEAAVAELNAQKKRSEIERIRADLAANNARAREEAMDRPPPATVRAYREVYGRDPRGWPPI